MLNSKARQQKIKATINELKYNLNIAYQKLQALIQYDSAFVVPIQSLDLIAVREANPDSTPGVQLMKMKTNYQTSMLQVERNRMLPDLSLNYFIGTNSYAGSQNYQGFQVGLSLPLFFGAQQAKIKAGEISISIYENLLANELTTLKAKNAALFNELMKYQESFNYYHSAGKQLSEEIMRTSQASYTRGEIDFFHFVLSVENALAITIDYFENISKYNQVALEINYLTK
jgi:cobalt-zinc-cadmium resistance protein CzcA